MRYCEARPNRTFIPVTGDTSFLSVLLIPWLRGEDSSVRGKCKCLQGRELSTGQVTGGGRTTGTSGRPHRRRQHFTCPPIGRPARVTPTRPQAKSIWVQYVNPVLEVSVNGTGDACSMTLPVAQRNRTMTATMTKVSQFYCRRYEKRTL